MLNRSIFACTLLVALFVLSSQSSASIIDLTSAGAIGTDGEAIFGQIKAGSMGTGSLEPFLRIQADGVEEGFNTDGTPQMDTKKDKWTHSIKVSDLPKITVGGVIYREFVLDIAENSSPTSLDAVKIYLADAGDLTDYPTAFGTPIYDLGSNYVKLDAKLGAGSGKGDMVMYIPSDLFGSDNNKFVYLYCKLGVTYPTSGSFEEWGYGADGPVTPEPATMILLAVGGVAILLRRRK